MYSITEFLNSGILSSKWILHQTTTYKQIKKIYIYICSDDEMDKKLNSKTPIKLLNTKIWKYQLWMLFVASYAHLSSEKDQCWPTPFLTNVSEEG